MISHFPSLFSPLNLYKPLFFCLSFFLFFNFQLMFGSIYTIDNLDEIWKEVENNIDKNTLVIFDINDVLTYPKDQILRSYAKPYRLKLMDKYFKGLSSEKIQQLSSKARLRKDWSQLVDPSFPQLIKKIQEKGAKAIALTSSKRGTFGLIKEVIDWRIQLLHEHGINFEHSFPDFPFLILKEDQFFRGFPLFKKGILFSIPYTKGSVLHAFLKKINYRPKKVILIDNKMKNHVSLAEVLEAVHIPFVGFYYMAVDRLFQDINFQVAELQYQHLVEKEEWLSD